MGVDGFTCCKTPLLNVRKNVEYNKEGEKTLNTIAPVNFTERILRNNVTCAYLCFLLVTKGAYTTEMYSSQSS